MIEMASHWEALVAAVVAVVVVGVLRVVDQALAG